MNVHYSEHGFGSDPNCDGREVVDLQDFLEPIVSQNLSSTVVKLIVLLAERNLLNMQDVQDITGMSWSYEQLRLIADEK